MRILFTGASSFTGLWFIRELRAAGHDVVATFRQAPGEYADPLRRRRVALAGEACRGVHRCSFGDSHFIELLRSEHWDLLCHHGAEVANYKSPDFDVLAALAGNTKNVAATLEALRAGRGRLMLTGSVFERGEGAGSEGLPAFSPYGLSKSLTAEVFRYHGGRMGLSIGKFVIPNPFGPYEEARFTSYLVKTWLAGRTATVQTPAYVRDNIHISLLAKAYAKFAADLPDAPGLRKCLPSGYVESQGTFALRIASAVRDRLALPCNTVLLDQAEFAEPRVRINLDPPDAAALGWKESQAWDEFVAYYAEGLAQ